VVACPVIQTAFPEFGEVMTFVVDVVTGRLGQAKRGDRCKVKIPLGFRHVGSLGALAFNVAARIQRAIPDYTSSPQDKVSRTRSCRTAPAMRQNSKVAAPHRHQTI
jgi:hypothetical protein